MLRRFFSGKGGILTAAPLGILPFKAPFGCASRGARELIKQNASCNEASLAERAEFSPTPSCLACTTNRCEREREGKPPQNLLKMFNNRSRQSTVSGWRA